MDDITANVAKLTSICQGPLVEEKTGDDRSDMVKEALRIFGGSIRTLRETKGTSGDTMKEVHRIFG